MRSSREKMLFRGLAAMAATAFLLAGCNDSSPTEPKVVANANASLVGAWTGTFNGIDYHCDSSAQASFQETTPVVDRGLSGTMSLPSCLGTFSFFDGYLQGNTFTGTAMWGDPEFYPLKGTLSGSSLEITIFNDTGGTPLGQLHLHQ